MDKSILVVDDDLFLRDLYSEMFIDEGFKVTTATDGNEAVAAVQIAKFDMILIDIAMPKKDGIQALAEIKAHDNGKQVPVIMLTNFGQEDLVKKAYELGATDYIVKYTVTPDEVVRRVKKIVDPDHSDFVEYAKKWHGQNTFGRWRSLFKRSL